MGDWTLYAGDTPVRTGLDEDTARQLVDWNLEQGNDEVYAMGPHGQRYPDA